MLLIHAGSGPKAGSKNSIDLRLEGARFRYAPKVRLSSTKKVGRGSNFQFAGAYDSVLQKCPDGPTKPTGESPSPGERANPRHGKM